MYKILSDDRLIFSPIAADDGYIAHSAHISKELNKVDTCEFVVPDIGKGYDLINKLTSIITVWDGDNKIFHGRCMDIEQDFYKQRKFHCEGELGFLNDSVVRPYSRNDTPGNIFSFFIAQHNLKVDASKRFLIGDVSSMQTEQIVRESSQYPNTLSELQEKLIENYGGYVIPRYSGENIYLDYRAVSGSDNNQIIQFGQNLLDMTQFIDASSVKTVLIPLGATVEGTDQRLDIKSVNDGKEYLENEDGIELFGRVEACEVWEDITIASNLKTAGQARLRDLIAESITLNLSAVDLSMLDVEADRIRIGEYNRVLSIPHNVDDFYQCTRIELDLSDPKQNRYTFGYPRPTLTDSINRFRLS